MEISGWGRYPKIDAEVRLPATALACAGALKDPGILIPRGLGRSYGDSSLAPQVLETNGIGYFIHISLPTFSTLGQQKTTKLFIYEILLKTLK